MAFWGQYDDASELPNVATGSDVGANLTAGDTAMVGTKPYVCKTAAAFPLAVWEPVRRRTYVFRANGLLSAFGVQAASYNGLLTSNALFIPLTGIFDAAQHVSSESIIVALALTQMIPASAPASTTVEFYRVRAGSVLSLGTVTLPNTAQFALATAVPGTTDLIPDDQLFVAFAALPPASDTQASALIAHVEVG